MKQGGQTFYHAGGGWGLGDVMDGARRVKGIWKLGVADASIMSAPISAVYQAFQCGIVKQVAEMISGLCLFSRTADAWLAPNSLPGSNMCYCNTEE